VVVGLAAAAAMEVAVDMAVVARAETEEAVTVAAVESDPVALAGWAADKAASVVSLPDHSGPVMWVAEDSAVACQAVACQAVVRQAAARQVAAPLQAAAWEAERLAELEEAGSVVAQARVL